MKIHMRPPPLPMPLAPPPKPPPTVFQLEMQAEELNNTAQQQKARLKKLYGARRDRQDMDEDADSEKHERDRRSDRSLDILT